MARGIKQGFIPTEIHIIHAGHEKFRTQYWDDLEVAEDLEVIPAFVCDSKSKTAKGTGERWALRNARNNSSKVQTMTMRNDPVDGLRVVALHKRSEGGRAWKVIDKHGFYFDMREDVLLDVLRFASVGPGGRIQDKFVWGIVGSQIKLVRVGSELHKALLAGSERKKLKKITNRNLEVGGIYLTKGGQLGVFLGFVDHTFKVEKQGLYRGNRHYHRDTDLAGLTLSKIKTNQKTMLWWNSYSADAKDLKKTKAEFRKDLTQEYDKQSDRYHRHSFPAYHFDFKKSHSFVEKIGQVSLDEDVILQLRDAAAKHAEACGEAQVERTVEQRNEQIDRWNNNSARNRWGSEPKECTKFELDSSRLYDFLNASELINIVPANAPDKGGFDKEVWSKFMEDYQWSER